jgi:hypothetical protein
MERTGGILLLFTFPSSPVVPGPFTSDTQFEPKRFDSLDHPVAENLIRVGAFDTVALGQRRPLHPRSFRSGLRS